MESKVKIKIKKSEFEVSTGETLIKTLFNLFPAIDQTKFCQQGKCKNCYCSILNGVETREILACQTRLNKSIRIMSLSKNLQNGINLE